MYWCNNCISGLRSSPRQSLLRNPILSNNFNTSGKGLRVHWWKQPPPHPVWPYSSKDAWGPATIHASYKVTDMMVMFSLRVLSTVTHKRRVMLQFWSVFWWNWDVFDAWLLWGYSSGSLQQLSACITGRQRLNPFSGFLVFFLLQAQ